jgi:hypothetical protein
MAGNNQAVLPDPQTAYRNLFDGVHQRVFFHKMAQLGYVPQTEKQAEWMLEMAGKLRLVDEEAAVKEAADAQDPFAAANAALDAALGRAGFQSVQKAAYDDEVLSIKQAAAAWAEHPEIYNSVLSLKAAEAEEYAQLLAQQQS